MVVAGHPTSLGRIVIGLSSDCHRGRVKALGTFAEEEGMAFVKQRGMSWYAYWDLYVDGERQTKAKSFRRDKRAAEDYAALKTADRIRGIEEPSQESFWSWWKRYQVEYLPALTEKVQAIYESMADRLLVPYWGHKSIGSIKRTHVREWITWASGEAGPGSVRKAFTVLSSILGYAFDLDIISSDPCDKMGKYLPEVTDKRKRPHLTTQQVWELAGEVHSDFKAMIVSMGILCLRPSESIALRVGDVDLDKGVLHVRRAAVDVPGKGMVERDTTKTESPRTIPLMGTEDAFRAHLKWKYRPLDGTGPARIPNKNDILFVSPRKGAGGLINEPALYNLVKRAAKRIGIEGLSADDLRHSAYANLVELTGDVTFAQRVAGHSSPVMGLTHYDTVTPARYKGAIEAVQNELRRLA